MDDQLVGMLRESAEEGDLNGILKPTIGGYSKKSVVEYLGRLKKQQQSLKDAYAEENGRLQKEREQLLTELEAAKAAAAVAEAAFQRRMNAETEKLQEELAELEADMDEALQRIAADDAQAANYEKALAEEHRQKELREQELVTMRIHMETEEAKLRDTERQLADRAEEIAQLQSMVQSLQEELAVDTTGELREQLQSLSGNVSALQGEVELRDRELENRDTRLNSLTVQEQKNHETIETLRQQLQVLSEQNEQMENENDALGRRLQEQMKQGIELCRENARLRTECAILQRRADAEQMRRRAAALTGQEL